ncbi:MAG: sulfotransferase domain-containing protein, partial [Streptosporangiales bacterium]
VLRDPVERAHSNWTHLWSAGLDPIGDFPAACAAEERRIAAGWAPFWHYTRLGRYGEQLERLFRLFPREQVLVLRYRDLVDSPGLALDAICAFLGVRPGIVSQVPRENVTTHPERSPSHRAVALVQRGAAAAGRHLPGTAGTALTQPLERFLQRSARPRQPLTWEQREQVLGYVEDDVRLLEKIAEADFGDWLQPKDRSGGLVGSRPAGQYQARNGQPAPGAGDTGPAPEHRG